MDTNKAKPSLPGGTNDDDKVVLQTKDENEHNDSTDNDESQISKKTRHGRGGRGDDRSLVAGPASMTFFTCGKEDDVADSIEIIDVWNNERVVELYTKVEKKSKSGKTTYMEKQLVSKGIWIPSKEALEKEAAENKELAEKNEFCDRGGRYKCWPIQVNGVIGIKWDGDDKIIPVKAEHRQMLEFLEDGRKFDMRRSSTETKLR